MQLRSKIVRSRPTFYKSVLTVWQELHSKTPLHAVDMKQEIIWNNRFIKVEGKTIFNKTWMNKGILRIYDLLDANDHFLFYTLFLIMLVNHCNFINETLIHMFCDCPVVKLFWKSVLNW